MESKMGKRIEEIAVRLTNILSVSGTEGELKASNEVYDIFSSMDYYKKHQENLRFVDVPEDKLGRKSVLAILEGGKNSSKETVVIIGHTDTVGVSDYGILEDYANKPYKLGQKLEKMKSSLPKDVRDDLESDEYLFGRGIFDMKTGVAIIISLMEEISKDIENFQGNIIFAAVCDEEVDSSGMLSVIPELVKLEEEQGYEYLALLDTDYMTEEFKGDKNKYIHIGTVGKLMPSFYIVGKETHVGESFSGLDPNQISSAIVSRINLNVDYCDVEEGEATLPPVTLKQRDLKPEYTVQTAKTSHLFFNYATHSSTPDQVLDRMEEAAEESFRGTIKDLNKQYKRYCELSGKRYKRLPWEAKVLSYEELYGQVKKELGEELDSKIEAFTKDMLEDRKVNAREFSLRLVEKVHQLWSNREPVVIVYYTPPYYPHIYVEGEEGREKKLLEAVEEAISSTDTSYDIVYKKFFPAISDLSYGSAPKDPKIIEALRNNMPGFGWKYSLPLEDMQKLDLPVLNIGSFGKDAHKFAERVHKDYSFNTAPQLLYKTITNLLGK